jgi:hypothetical protein
MQVMAAQITVNGLQITVPVNELREALSQLGLTGLSTPRRVQSPDQSNLHDQPRHVSEGPRIDFVVSNKKVPDTDLTAAFLQSIATHERQGLGTPITALMAATGVATSKGVGPKMSIVNRVIDSRGFAIPDVYESTRDSNGDRCWKPGSKLDELLSVLLSAKDNE